jgi:hypothetical protein
MTATPKPPETPTADLLFGRVPLPVWHSAWLLDRALGGDIEAAFEWLQRFGGEGALEELRQQIASVTLRSATKSESGKTPPEVA